MDNRSGLGQPHWGHNGPVADPRPDQQEQICRIHGSVGGRRSVHPDHAEIPRILGRYGRNPHHGRNHRDPRPLGEDPQLLLRLGGKNAAARTDQGPFSLLQGGQHPFNLAGMPLAAGLIAADFRFFRIGKIQLGFLHIHRDINQNRAVPPSRGNMERLLKDARDVLRPLDQVAVFDKGLAGAGDIRFLEHIPAQQVADNLPRNHYQRDRIHVGSGNTGNQVQRTRPRGGNTDAGAARYPGIAGSGMGGVLLLAYQDMPDLCLGKCIVKRADRRSRQPEHHRDSLPL